MMETCGGVGTWVSDLLVSRGLLMVLFSISGSLMLAMIGIQKNVDKGDWFWHLSECIMFTS